MDSTPLGYDVATIRPLVEGEWAEAMTLAARSFHAEPFSVALFGEPPQPRFEQALEFYRALPWRPADQSLGAFVGGVLVGASLGSHPGGCHVCEYVDPERPPEDPAAFEEWVFEVNTGRAHADQGPHAWVSRLVVDPALQGSGLGAALLARSLAGFRLADPSVRVLLECQPHREGWYAARGFERVRTFPDPGQPDCLLMRIDP